MAIKGKRKPKARGGRVVTAGPRPAYVPPRVPPLQRTGARFLVVLIIEAAIFALLVGFGEQSEADRQRETIGEFTALVDAALASAGEFIQPLPGGSPQVLPQLPARLGELESEQPPDEDTVIADADAWISALNRAADGVSGIEVPQQGLDPEQRLGLSEAQAQMDRGLRLFAGLAGDLKVAAQIRGRARGELVVVIQSQLPVVSGAFDSGYGKLQEVARRAGLAPSASAPAGGVPPGFDPTMPGQLPPGFDPTMPGQLPPGFDPTMPDTQVVPADPEAGGGGGGQGGGGGNG